MPKSPKSPKASKGPRAFTFSDRHIARSNARPTFHHYDYATPHRPYDPDSVVCSVTELRTKLSQVLRDNGIALLEDQFAATDAALTAVAAERKSAAAVTALAAERESAASAAVTIDVAPVAVLPAGRKSVAAVTALAAERESAASATVTMDVAPVAVLPAERKSAAAVAAERESAASAAVTIDVAPVAVLPAGRKSTASAVAGTVDTAALTAAIIVSVINSTAIPAPRSAAIANTNAFFNTGNVKNNRVSTVPTGERRAAQKLK